MELSPAPFSSGNLTPETPTPETNNSNLEEEKVNGKDTIENYYHHYPYRHHRRRYYPVGSTLNMQLVIVIFSLIVLFTAIMMVGLSK